MKMSLVLPVVALVALFSACSTPKRVATLEGRGTKQVYAASFDHVWRAAVDAAQLGDLEVVRADRASGYIDARRRIQVHTFGENVGIWVRQLAPDQTEVEVVSRQAGPPALWVKNWQNEIQRAIAANLTREPAAMGAPSNGSEAIPGTGSSTGIRTPAPSSAPAETRDTMIEERRTLDRLRSQRETAERALASEVDATKRDLLQRQADRLREELRAQEQRVNELEGRVE